MKNLFHESPSILDPLRVINFLNLQWIFLKREIAAKEFFLDILKIETQIKIYLLDFNWMDFNPAELSNFIRFMRIGNKDIQCRKLKDRDEWPISTFSPRKKLIPNCDPSIHRWKVASPGLWNNILHKDDLYISAHIWLTVQAFLL